ncbi:MAG: hypothetical protein MUF63_17585 [Rhodobacteraceae bacterium]|jgi:hypothetical protein|nr:hypothetical protein [Paracoccaceae bacterium]
MTGRTVAAGAALFLLWAGAAAACPDVTAYGARYDLSGKTLYVAQQFPVQAGGDQSIGACGIVPETDKGQGYVISAPDFSMQLSGMAPYQLVISVVSACDSVLLVNTASQNWYYDDDDNGNLDARIVLTRPADGWLDIWVGTHDGASCDAVLTLETFDR